MAEYLYAVRLARSMQKTGPRAGFCMKALRQINGLAGLHGFVAIQLADDFHGGVHAQDGDTGIDGDDVPVGHVGGHGAAAALVYLAQGGDLPLDTGGIQGGTDVLHGLGGGIGSMIRISGVVAACATVNAAGKEGRLILICLIPTLILTALSLLAAWILYF